MDTPSSGLVGFGSGRVGFTGGPVGWTVDELVADGLSGGQVDHTPIFCEIGLCVISIMLCDYFIMILRPNDFWITDNVCHIYACVAETIL